MPASGGTSVIELSLVVKTMPPALPSTASHIEGGKMGFAKLAHIVSVGLASAAANSGIALLAVVPASAADPNFTYVQNSLVQSTIISGPLDAA